MRKRITLILCLTLFLSIMLPVVSAFAVLGPQWVWSQNGLPVKLREYPSTDAPVLTKFSYGTCLTGCSYYNGTWTAVSYGDKTGYIMTRFLMSEEPPYHPVYPTAKPTAKPTTAPSSKTSGMFSAMKKVDYYVTVNPSNGASYGNMRWAPSDKQPVMCIYYPGYQLRVLQTDGVWSQVLDEETGNCGFMRTFLLQQVLVASH